MLNDWVPCGARQLLKVFYWGFGILGVNGIGFVVAVGGTTTYPKSVETLGVISGLCNKSFQLGIY